MFIKLTRLDSSPIWLNASFVVTVEPRKGGGTIVVPIGDGLDYDVREPAEVVLSLLVGAPAPAVVPVPARDALTQSPDDVSPAAIDSAAVRPLAPVPYVAKPAAKPVAKPVAQPVAEPAAAPAKKAAKGKKATRTTRAKKTEAAEDAAVDPPPVAEPPPEHVSVKEEPRAMALRKVKKPKLELSTEQVDRLKKMMPKSMKKLTNTLAAQFKQVNAEKTIEALAHNGFFEIDGDRIIWKS